MGTRWWLNLRIVIYPEKKYRKIPYLYFMLPFSIFLKYVIMIFLWVLLEINVSKGICWDNWSANTKYLSHIYARTANSWKYVVEIFEWLENFLQLNQKFWFYFYFFFCIPSRGKWLFMINYICLIWHKLISVWESLSFSEKEPLLLKLSHFKPLFL